MDDARKAFIDKVRKGEVPGFSIDPDNPAMAYDPMPLDTSVGTRVRFTGYGGYDWQQKKARELLTVDAIYTVANLDVGDWSSSVQLEEKPGHTFNAVMFEIAGAATPDGR